MTPTPTHSVPCSWFAMCPNPADGCVDHPALGYVPTCERCAEKFGLELIRGEVMQAAGGDVEGIWYS